MKPGRTLACKVLKKRTLSLHYPYLTNEETGVQRKVVPFCVPSHQVFSRTRVRTKPPVSKTRVLPVVLHCPFPERRKMEGGVPLESLPKAACPQKPTGFWQKDRPQAPLGKMAFCDK